MGITMGIIFTRNESQKGLQAPSPDSRVNTRVGAGTEVDIALNMSNCTAMDVLLQTPVYRMCVHLYVYRGLAAYCHPAINIRGGQGSSYGSPGEAVVGTCSWGNQVKLILVETMVQTTVFAVCF